MAVDKLVDSTQLDSDLTDVANAIRAKSGGSSQLAFPSGFISEIGNISGGGGLPDWYSKISTGTVGYNFSSVTFTGDVVIDLGTNPVKEFSVNQANATVAGSSLEIKCGNLAFATGAFGGPGSGTLTKANLDTIILSCANNPSVTSQICRRTRFAKILGKPFLCTSFGSGNYKRFDSTVLKEFYLVPNKVTAGEGGINTAVLEDASLVSVANALSGTATGQTLTISNATTKAKCDTIMGTVSQVTEGGETYDFFTQDASGTVSLRSFITTTKGWTLA